MLRSKMRIGVRLVALVIGSWCGGVTAASAQTRPCWDTAATQAQLNACAADEAKAAEAEMKRVFAEVLKAHATDRAFIRRLKAAQVAWLKYRDAELAARFPDADAEAQHGSAFPMCSRLEHARLYKERTAALRSLLSAEKHRDACSGAGRK